MKIKYNIPMINNLKRKFKLIENKIVNNDKKIPLKYYALLILMIILGGVTLTLNVNRYTDSKTENYKEFVVNNTKPISSDKVIVSNKFDCAISSISTNISNNDEETVDLNENKYIKPMNNEILKQYSGNQLVYSKTLDMWKIHPGIDIKANVDDKVKSASDGTIIEISKDSFYGYKVKILDEEQYTFVYSNLDEEIIVKEGQNISKGDIIGQVGVSALGEAADESHLHFEILKEGEQINPSVLINFGE